jgi:hypothetical protein
MLKVYDDLFTPDFIMEMSKAAHMLPWTYSNVANRDQFPLDSTFTKGTHKFFGSSLWFRDSLYNVTNNTPDIFLKALDHLQFSVLEEDVDMHCIDSNLQVYGQDGTAHKDDFISDGTDRTILLYCHHEWKEEWGGALEILNDDGEVIESVLPLPGRVVYLDSSVLHRARAPLVKNEGRMSIAYRMRTIQRK